MANTEGEGVEDGSTEVEVEVVEVGLGATLPVVVGVVEGVREGMGGLEAVVTVEEEGELVLLKEVDTEAVTDRIVQAVADKLTVRLGEAEDVMELEPEGVGQAEGFTESPVVGQAAGQVQGMGAPTPAGQ